MENDLPTFRDPIAKEISSALARASEYKDFNKEYADISKRIRGEISRYQVNEVRLHDKAVVGTFEHVICAFVNNHRDVEYSSPLVYLCGPLVYSLKAEDEIYYSFESLMNLISKSPPHFPLFRSSSLNSDGHLLPQRRI